VSQVYSERVLISRVPLLLPEKPGRTAGIELSSLKFSKWSKAPELYGPLLAQSGRSPKLRCLLSASRHFVPRLNHSINSRD
jgi:hypothetical protein